MLPIDITEEINSSKAGEVYEVKTIFYSTIVMEVFLEEITTKILISAYTGKSGLPTRNKTFCPSKEITQIWFHASRLSRADQKKKARVQKGPTDTSVIGARKPEVVALAMAGLSSQPAFNFP